MDSALSSQLYGVAACDRKVHVCVTEVIKMSLTVL